MRPIKKYMKNPDLKLAVVKIAIILIPSYLMAYLTDKMVWVIPTLVASGIVAANIDKKEKISEKVDSDDVD